jgi:hypothetical protein
MAVTHASDTQGGNFSGFAQGIDSSVDGRTLYLTTNVETAGSNTVRFSRATPFAEFDVLNVCRPWTTLDPRFRIVNRGSGKLLEVLSAPSRPTVLRSDSGADGKPDTSLIRTPAPGGYLVVNRNRSKLLDIPRRR